VHASNAVVGESVRAYQCPGDSSLSGPSVVRYDLAHDPLVRLFSGRDAWSETYLVWGIIPLWRLNDNPVTFKHTGSACHRSALAGAVGACAGQEGTVAVSETPSQHLAHCGSTRPFVA
jgi:hypothetical protein